MKQLTMDLVLLHIESLSEWGAMFYFTLHTCIVYFCNFWFLMDTLLASKGYDYYFKM